MKHVIIMPDLGQTTSEAKIVSWLKEPGEKLAMGEPLLEVETDKATMDVEAFVGGFLRKTLANEGDMVAASNPVAILTDTLDEEFDEEPKSKSADTTPAKLQKTRFRDPSPSSGRIAAVPAARSSQNSLASNYRLFAGSGPQGLISKVDVERFASGAKAPAEATFLSQPDKALRGHGRLSLHVANRPSRISM